MKKSMRQKGVDEVFCRSCGEIIKKEAEICPHCGVRQRGSPSLREGKSKTVAVLLAIFLPPFNWLYTYKKDSVKFWVGLILSILEIMLYISIIGIIMGLIIGVGVWLWAIIDAAIKDADWYEDF